MYIPKPAIRAQCKDCSWRGKFYFDMLLPEACPRCQARGSLKRESLTTTTAITKAGG